MWGGVSVCGVGEDFGDLSHLNQEHQGQAQPSSSLSCSGQAAETALWANKHEPADSPGSKGYSNNPRAKG